MSFTRVLKLICLLLLLLPGEPALPMRVYATGTGQIGVGVQAGYFYDKMGRNPTPQETALFHSGLPIYHNFWPGDVALDSPDRALYFYSSSLESYPPGPPYFLREQIITNLRHYPGVARIVVFLSEPNNSGFKSQYLPPSIAAALVAEYVDFAVPLCPSCQYFAPILAQENVRGIDNPFDYERRFLQALRDMGRQDVIKQIGPAYTHISKAGPPVNGHTPFSTRSGNYGLSASNMAGGMQR